MAFNFLNPWMLLGAAGIALPVLVHLLSKRKYDVVQWGAMQFLEPQQATRRRLQLEQLLLLLLRMGLIALIVFAMSRPWASGGFLANLVSNQSRDVVFVIDGSLSMGWEGKAVTPHAAAVQWIHETLEDMRPGDTVAVLDAREQVRPVLATPTHDFGLVREKLAELPAPSGAADIAAAIQEGVQILSTTGNISREIIVLTDGQSHGWRTADENYWSVHDALLEQPSVKPRTWVVNVNNTPLESIINFHVGKIEINREQSVPDFPVQIRTTIGYSGAKTAATRRVYLEVDGQRLQNKTVTLQLQPGGEETVEFEHRLHTAGAHILSVVLDDDAIPGDNRSDVAVYVTKSLPVLIVNGDPQNDPTRDEAFFVTAALSPIATDAPWIQPRVVDFSQLKSDDLKQVEVVVLANVPQLENSLVEALRQFVQRGGGLYVALGDKVKADVYNKLFKSENVSLLPAELEKIEQDDGVFIEGVHILDTSLSLPWLTRFKAEQGGDLADVRFEKWWKMRTPDKSIAANEQKKKEEADDDASPKIEVSESITLARLQNNAPLAIVHDFGRGRVLLFATPVDADWSTLPTKQDFVTWMHESLFYLARGQTERNLHVGAAIVLPVTENFVADNFIFRGPGKIDLPPQLISETDESFARLDQTELPGVYHLQPKESSNEREIALQRQSFVLNYNREESQLEALKPDEKNMLIGEERMQFIQDREALQAAWLTDDSRSEFWHLLFLVFLGMLVVEVLLTRHLVQGGHAAID